MAEFDPNSDLVLLLLLLLLHGDDDPDLRDAIYRRVRDGIRSSRGFDREFDFLLRRSLIPPLRSGRGPAREVAHDVAASLVEGFRSGFEPRIERRLSGIEKSLEELAAFGRNVTSEVEGLRDVVATQEQLEKLADSVRELEREFQDLAWTISTGADPGRVPLRRYVPVRIFVADEVVGEEVLPGLRALFGKLAEALGLDQAADYPEEEGSWWKRATLKTRDLATSHEVKETVDKLEQALEIQHLDKPLAEANHHQAEAAAAVVAALKDTHNACMQVGSLLVVKVTSESGTVSVAARTLSKRELRHLEENQSILRDPAAVLEMLQGANASPSELRALRQHPEKRDDNE